MRIVSRELTKANVTQQTKPTQVKNHAGGYVFKASDMEILNRFLILGTEKGTYYVNQQALTLDMANTVISLIQSKGEEVLKRVTEVSLQGLAPRQDSTIFTLALLLTYGNNEVKQGAANVVPNICRTGTMMFQLVAELDNLRGWGRSARKAIANWYTTKSDEQLAYQTTKYRARNGWSHRDVLRLCHAKGGDNPLYKWLVGKDVGNLSLLEGFLKAQAATSPKEIVDLLKVYHLEREHIPTNLLTDKKVNEALLPNMKYIALLRNLGNLSKYGVIDTFSNGEKFVVDALSSKEDIARSRVHPMQILQALSTYSSGKGVLGGGAWNVSPRVVTALENAFKHSFTNVEPTGKRYILGLDVSGSMDGNKCAGSTLTCREAQTAMAMITSMVEPMCHTVLYDTRAYEFGINPNDSLKSQINDIARIGGGGTDCSLPVKYALDRKINVDAFVIYTDSETWRGTHPYQVLEEYRRKVNSNAKLINVAMATNKLSIADNSDKLSMDVVGFDPTVPSILRQFVLGEL